MEFFVFNAIPIGGFASTFRSRFGKFVVDMNEITAMHEAGHAVVAVLLGGVVESVTIEVPDQLAAGATGVVWQETSARDQCINDMRVALAGPIAEMVFLGEYDHLRIKQEHVVDWEIVSNALKRLTLSDREAEKLVTSVANELYHRIGETEVWAAINDVAERLTLDGTIDGDVVYELTTFWLRHV